MNAKDQRVFLTNCIDFQQSCNANGVDTHLMITSRWVRVICRPLNKHEEHFEYDLHDSLESLQKDLMSDIEYVIKEHFNTKH